MPRAGELAASESDRAELCGHAALSVAGQEWELRLRLSTEHSLTLNTPLPPPLLYISSTQIIAELPVYMAKSKKGGGTPKGKGPSKPAPHRHRGRPAYSSRTSGTHASNSYDG